MLFCGLRNIKRSVFFGFFIFIALVAVTAAFVSGRRNHTLVVSHQLTGEVYYTGKIREEDVLSFGWIHSFEHVDWDEYYRVEKKRFTLFTIAVGGFGAGIPAEMDCTYRYADGLIYMENIKGSVFPEFNWINSQTQLKYISVNDRVILTGRDLPEHGRIKLTLR
ncbi:MAG: DUF1850 domain-containing protein [Fusobacteriaceae bacterium]|jgi:hypothetical protein|nr:DUF1850 domain-containing protein [Fusobacteriaceae bacterium]